MNSFVDYTTEQAYWYHAWYETGEGKIIGGEQREVMGIGLGDVRFRTLLDIGCGTGFFTAWFSEIGFSAVGVDSSEAMLHVAREKCGDGVEFMLADAGKLPFDDRSFDVAVFATSLEFTPDAGAAITEAKRVAASEILLLMLNPDHRMNIARKKRAEYDGSVFRGARLIRPEALAKLFEDDGMWSGSLVIEPGHSPYYILKMTCKEVAENKNTSARLKKGAKTAKAFKYKKEGGSTMAAKVDKDKCTGCGTCVEACPLEAIKLENEKAVVDEETCTECGSCVSECPLEVISLP